MDNTKALTVQDVADILKIAKNTVYELVKRGELNSYKVGRKVRFTLKDVESYIENSKKIQKSFFAIPIVLFWERCYNRNIPKKGEN